MNQRTLFVFRQDLRINDNTGLRHAIKESKEVVPVFIFDTTILSTFPLSDNRVAFLEEAVQRIEKNIAAIGGQLIVCYGDSTTIIPQLLQQLSCDSLYYNRSYGVASDTRDTAIKERCKEHDIGHKNFGDYLLVEPDDVPQRKVFTPFYKLRMEVPKRTNLLGITAINTPLSNKQLIPEQITPSLVHPAAGSIPYNKLQKHIGNNQHRPIEQGPSILESREPRDYNHDRNFPAINGTSRISPYLRFGIISIRQLFRKALKQAIAQGATGIAYNAETETITMDRKVFKNSYISELAWREFRQHVNHYFPQTRTQPFQQKRDYIHWTNDPKFIDARKQGKTGYPIVDAGMRQLKEENWMHGRVRMIVASFLTKDLHVDRKIGEEHFRDYLIDYDTNVNIGNRQWSASVGADPKPLRIFNPILQSERYDPLAKYIKKRVPEIADQEIKAIHNPLKYDLQYTDPIVDHYHMSREAKEMYKKSTEQFKTLNE